MAGVGDATGDEKVASSETELLCTGVATATASNWVSVVVGEGEVRGGEEARRGAGDDAEDRAVLTTGLSEAAHGDASVGGGVPVVVVVVALHWVAQVAGSVSSEKQLSDTEPSPSASPSPVSSVDPLECSSAEKGEPAAADKVPSPFPGLLQAAFLTGLLTGAPGSGTGGGGCDLCSAASAFVMLSCFFHLVLLFWNHIFTCVSVTPRSLAISARSDEDRYFFSSNCFSSSKIWRPVKVVLAFLRFRSAAPASGTLSLCEDSPEPPPSDTPPPRRRLVLLVGVVESLRYHSSW